VEEADTHGSSVSFLMTTGFNTPTV